VRQLEELEILFPGRAVRLVAALAAEILYFSLVCLEEDVLDHIEFLGFQ
jgi:hypothetical protein